LNGNLYRRNKKKNKVIVISGSSTMKEALKILSINNILSAPVSDSQNILLGFVDVLDIVGFVLNAWRKQSSTLYTVSISSIIEESFFSAKVSDAVNFSKWDFPVFLSIHSELMQLLKTFAYPGQLFKPHRILALDQNNMIEDLISQSDMISFAVYHIEKFSNQVQMSITELGLVHGCFMMPLDSTVIDALEALYNNRVSSVALINYEGQISGNFSASDLRGITPEGFDMFHGSILQFLAKQSHPSSPITCPIDIRFDELLKLISNSHVHRIYAVDKNNRPQGVISLGDMIEILYKISSK